MRRAPRCQSAVWRRRIPHDVGRNPGISAANSRASDFLLADRESEHIIFGMRSRPNNLFRIAIMTSGLVLVLGIWFARLPQSEPVKPSQPISATEVDPLKAELDRYKAKIDLLKAEVDGHKASSHRLLEIMPADELLLPDPKTAEFDRSRRIPLNALDPGQMWHSQIQQANDTLRDAGISVPR